MFGFGNSRSDPLADARSAERWIAAGVTSDALTMHERIRGVLAEVTAPGVRADAQAARRAVRHRRARRRRCSRR